MRTVNNSKFLGFFPKKNCYENHLVNEGVTEICSVSECIRSGPENWIDLWKHNDLGFYDTESIALDIIKKNSKDYTLFAYKLFLFCYEDGKLKTKSKMISRANKLNNVEDLAGYTFVGLDVISCDKGSNYFECSALSCNAGFEEYKVNEFCLLQDLDLAMSAHKQISESNYEPGEQYLFEVYRRDGIL